MTQAQQPEALRLADLFDQFAKTFGEHPSGSRTCAAVELRRQHARILELEQGKCLHQIAEPAAVHPDDVAVDALAALMKAKLAKQRGKGYGGWDTDCTQQRLSDLLRGHVDKGDPVDVANFCAMLSARGEGIAAAPQAVQPAIMPKGESAAAQLRAMATNYPAGHSWDKLDARACIRGALEIEALRALLAAAPAHPAEGVPAPMPVAHPHHCTARTAGGSCEECEGHAQAMAEWNTERAALAATQPAAQGMEAQDAECLEIGRELCRACAELPWGYEIILYLEQGAGTVHWMDTDGNEHDIGEDGVFSEKIGYAIATAQAKQGEQA